jgi:hypothetical protein
MSNMDDYVTLIERYVREAWACGRSTADIKQDLLAKNWSAAMVELVIDRLVEQKVNQKEGETVTVNGPDWWTQPTWSPPSTGWIKAKPPRSSPPSTPHSHSTPATVFSLYQTAAPPPDDPPPPATTPSSPSQPSAPALIHHPPPTTTPPTPNSTQILTAKLAQIKTTQQKVAAVQDRAFQLLGGLILVAILAIIWRIVVIK